MRRLAPVFAIFFAAALVVLLARPFTPVAASSRPPIRANGITTVTTDTILVPTYSYAPALFTATNTTYNIPYPVLHWGEYDKTGRTKSDKAYTRLTLENDWLRVSILPELGGRVYELIYKPTGHNELYRNPVIKPTHWGPPEQGWWLAAGGIEWGLPVEEHGYESALPWSYSIQQTSAGATVTLRDSTQADRLRATVEVFLPSERAALITRPKIENGRSVPLTYKWWINAMLAPGAANTVGPDLRFIFPIDAVTVHSTNDDRLPGHGWPGPSGPEQWISWPIYNGVDWSRLGNFDEWFGFFGRPQAMQDFVGVYDSAANEGVIRVFPLEVAQGIKGFAMGWARPIDPGNWTDDGSTYVELHGGLAPTFWDSVSLAPGQSIQWEEVWYPVAGLGGVTAANDDFALHVQHSGSALDLNLFSTWSIGPSHELSVWQRSTCARIARIDLPVTDAATPFQTSIPTSIPLNDLAIHVTYDTYLALGYNAIDCLAPVTRVDQLPRFSYTTAFNVAWSARDYFSGVESSDVQYKDGYTGVWTTWLTDTHFVNATFTSQAGRTYFFRARSRDKAGHLEPYGDEEWGQAFSTVLLDPAAVLETSRIVAPRFVAPGQPISYTLVLSNTGSISGNIALTNTLPTSLTLVSGTLLASSGAAPTFDGARVRWSGIVAENASVFITYALTPTLDLGLMQPQTSTVVIGGGVQPVTRAATTALARLTYLALITRNNSP
ncbi:MAG TPA: DUF5107 domain-containing protein [Anaerolineae bacterium]|nr:DUF5107 domain-containing protein [Anaerolineae bacterium]